MKPIKSDFVIFFILTLTVFAACRSEPHVANLQNQWSGLNPLSIPLNTREKEYARENIISNPSFELGRNYFVDTVKLSFNLPGWKKIGDHVYWTNIQNDEEYEQYEASNGIHAIKIERERADETDEQGEGIISDYIKVIPANYRLTMDVRLEHIESNHERLGVDLYDAVNIRLYCYDKNKVLLNNHAYHPKYGIHIDNSFKGMQFSNFDYLDDFGWARIIGRAGNFPFDEGNLPDETRYVRIFAGLKGTGVMWVDMVDFRLSQENFTLLEYITPFFDSSINHSSYLLPYPQKITSQENIDLILNEESGPNPFVLIPKNMDKYSRSLINDFVNRLKNKGIYQKNATPVITNLTSSILESENLVINIGNTRFASQYAEQVSEEQIYNLRQAYIIKKLDEPKNIIFIHYNDSEGLFHALHTLNQLMDGNSKSYHHCNIIDYPDFERRTLLFPNSTNENKLSYTLEDLSEIASFGFNNFVAEPYAEAGNQKEFLKESVSAMKSFDRLSSGIPYLGNGLSLRKFRFDPVEIPVKEEWEEEMFNKFRSPVINKALEYADLLNSLSGWEAGTLFLSEDVIFDAVGMGIGQIQNSMKTEKVKFLYDFTKLRDLFWETVEENIRDDLKWQTYLTPLISDNRLYNRLGKFEYLYFQNMGSYPALFQKCLWNGPTHISYQVDYADYHRFSSCNPLSISLLDNTFTTRKDDLLLNGYLSRYPGKALTGIIFEPFLVELSGLNAGQLNDEYFINIGNSGELEKLRLATAADYLWNQDHYDPYFSVWKILVNKYGKEVAMKLLTFNDLYYKLLSLCMVLEDEGFNQKLMKSGDEILIRLEENWEQISEIFESNIKFLNELSDYKNRVISRFYQLRRLPQPQDDNG